MLGMRRAPFVAASALIVFGFAAAAATAAPLTPKLLQSRGLTLPQSGAPVSQPQLYVESNPVVLKVGGFSYRMSLTAFKVIGKPATIDLTLGREAGRSEQLYDYQFTPGGIGFTADLANGTTAHLTSGAGVAPSTLNLTYTATPGSAIPSHCTLSDGRKTSYIAHTSGTISVSSLSVATKSSLFGNVTTRPKTATLDYDPGCTHGDSQVVRFVCEGPAILKAASPDGSAWWVADLHGSAQAIQLAGAMPAVSSALTLRQQVDTTGRIADLLPGPSFTTTGATATFQTTSDPFMSGEARFTSTSPPVVSKSHSCTDLETFAKRTYVLDVYRGTLAPSHSSPLTALFDTGSLIFGSEPAQLQKVVYTG